MNDWKHLPSILVLLMVGACAQHDNQEAVQADPQASLSSGLNQDNMDPVVRAQDDTYRHVSGIWLKNTPIPADKARYGAFDQLRERAESDVREIIEQAASTKSEPGTAARKIGDFYNSFMDEQAAEAAGLAPLAGELEAIDAISNKSELIAHLAHMQRMGIANPLALFVNQDKKDSTRYAAYLYQAGLGMPDRSYYLDDQFADTREKYSAYVTALNTLAGLDDPAGRARVILAMETDLARAQWERVKNRDPVATYNPYTFAEADAAFPGMDWESYAEITGFGGEEKFIIYQPEFIAAVSDALEQTSLDDWKAYLSYMTFNSLAPYLSKPYVDLNFDFYGRTLSGTEENRARWKRGVEITNGAVGELVGELFVAAHYKPASKIRMDKMIADLREAFRLSIDKLEWMGEETKAQAQDKLAKFTPKIGYPEKWRDYSGLVVRSDDLVGNILRSNEFDHDYQIARLGGPIDRTLWGMTPQTVNAYYNPVMNEVVFPAAILRPPFFNTEADDAVNYGAIGAVIGHEFSHGFDDKGRMYDGDGNLRDWWTEEDNAEFTRRAQKLIDQYSKFSQVEGNFVNGALTLGENIGDLAGLTMAYRAYHLSLAGKAAPVIDGLTGDQRFFMGWAQVWRTLIRPEEAVRLIKVDPHSPGEFRANGTLRNIDDFQNAFATKPGDGMYLAPEDRVRIW
jgi:predicted metalloendopeptidase